MSWAFLIAWVKIVHIAGIALWSAGLLALPILYAQRRGLEGAPLHRLHAFTRMLYVALVSPAAFIAIGSGTALIIAMGTYENWFSAKLVGVSVMTGLHIFSGLVILRLFEPGRSYPAWRLGLVMPLTIFTIAAILVLVLGKPRMEWPQPLADLFAPGALSQLIGPLIGVGK
ncbi:MAG: CopD family protein [Devosia sp.]|uniref:CopD family protein n=1 Tax=Devosia sp. TaxID=1871048 RepID=UPI0024CBC49B|nr:CopD family protein [Devosia sp.]UYN99048.1 MAG: CopD family protein [Devosia sp.]